MISPIIKRFYRQIGVVRRTIASAKLDAVISTLAIALSLLGMRQLGWLQPLELASFDLMMRLRPDEDIDRRLLVVAITETDIEALKQYPISDRVLAQVLEELYKLEPTAIGLDLARNVPVEPGHASVRRSFQNPKLIAITSIGNSGNETVPPPPGIPPERIGFSDVLIDPDDIVRRNLMYASTETATLHSLSLRLALAYLAKEGISPQPANTEDVRLDKTVFARLQTNSGGYQTIDDGDYQIILNYRSARNAARQVTIAQVLNRQVDPNWVKDKIVLIGTTAPTVKDLFNTPYSATEKGNPRMAGVLIHAQIVSQILSAVKDDRPLFWFWSEWMEILWIAGWTSLGGVLGAKVQNLSLVVLGVIAMPCVLFAAAMLLFLQAGWIPLATPAIASIASAIVSQLQQTIGRQKMVMKLLGQQTSPEIADALWNSRDRLLDRGLLPGRALTATMLLTDLKGFSTISENMSPESVMDWLNEYLAVMTQLVQSHQGIINKFTGDGILAVFGVPVPRTNEEEIALDARRAVACALAMGDRLQELNRSWGDRGLPVVQMRVGIFTGPVMVGSLGGKDRLEYGVIGDSVNIASRLESCEKDRQSCLCRVLIARETLVRIQGQFQVESWGLLELKGKQQKVDVYRVVGYLPDLKSFVDG